MIKTHIDIFEHFNGERHSGFLENVSITFIKKVDPSDPKMRGNY